MLQDGGHFIPQIPLEMSNGFARKKHFNNDLGRVGTQGMPNEQDGVHVVEERRLGNLGGGEGETGHCWRERIEKKQPQQRQGQGQDLMLVGVRLQGIPEHATPKDASFNYFELKAIKNQQT